MVVSWWIVAFCAVHGVMKGGQSCDLVTIATIAFLPGDIVLYCINLSCAITMH